MKFFYLSLLCYLFYFSSAIAQVSFAPTDTIAFYGGYLGTTDNAPIYPLDMDKDGDDDLIYTKSNKIYFKKNTGTGTFEEEKIIHTSFSHIYSVSNLADLNNDSHLDLAISTRDTIKILYGTGESFKEVRKTFEFFYSSKLILADFNKDGKTDLASSPVDKIVIREDVGIAFSAPKTFYTEANLYRYDLTDLNEDGQLDLLVFTYQNEFKILLGSSDGSLTAAYSKPLGEYVITYFKIGDSNLDGYKDVVFYDTDRVISLVYNSSSKKFTEQAAVTISSNRYLVRPFLLTDVNKNGALDLVYQNNSRLVYREGNGTGNFLDEKTILDYAFIDANSMFSFNSNKDGIGDVMLADINKFVIVELNSAIGSTKVITEGYYDDGGGLFSDDVDADGYKDIVTTTRNGSLLIRWGNASHDYTKFTRYKIPFGCIQSVMTDVNKDGINDLIVTRQNYYNGISELRLLQGKGNRQFQNDVGWKAVDYPSKPIITDIDKDGEKDVLVFIRDSNEIIWLDPENPDYYEYTPSRRITISGKGISGIALADINKDGFTDLLTSNNSSSNFSILTNNTLGNFTETILEKANAILYIQGVAALDYNNDTYPDLLAMTSNGSNEYELQIYLNNKSGSFIYSSSVALKDLYLPQNFDVVDIDADGDKDFIVSNWDYSAANVFIQDKGNYENKGSKVINLGGQFASFYGDLNDDGKPDVFSVALIFGNTFQILNNSVTNPDVTKTQINVTEIKSNSVAISFSPTTHNGRLVIIKKKDALTTLPADGQFYAANTLFGKGGNLEPDAYVVESGNEDSIIVTGLSPSTAYTISVVDYNTNPPLKNIINYSGNKQEKSFTTKSAPPVIASIPDVSSSGMKEISIDLMVSDEDTPLTDLSFSFGSSNSSVVAGENITKQISDNKVFMKFTPKALGQTVITVVVTDPEKNTAEAKMNYSLIVLGLEDEFNTHPHLFPNPFSSTISIRHEQRDQKLMIFDVMGRLLKQFDQIPEEVDLSEQPNGVYIFRTASGEVMKTMKR